MILTARCQYGRWSRVPGPGRKRGDGRPQLQVCNVADKKSKAGTQEAENGDGCMRDSESDPEHRTVVHECTDGHEGRRCS